MTQIKGEILSENRTVGYIINRSDALDAALIRGGIDPTDVNYALTPLVGASRHAEIVTLVLMLPKAALGVRPFDFPNAENILRNSEDVLYAVRLYEPYSGSGGSGAGAGDKPGDIGSGSIGTNPVDTGPAPEVEEPPTRPGVEIGPSDDPNVDGSPVIARAAASGVLQTFRSGRQLLWNKLTLVEAREILASTAGNGGIAVDPGKPNYGGSVFALKFVDARARLLGQTVFAKQANASLEARQAGIARDQWNMLADNPLHLIAATAKKSTYKPPRVDGPLYPGIGIMAPGMKGIPSPSGWYEDECWLSQEIISAYVSVATSVFDRQDITFTFNKVCSENEIDGDMLNLDLRGKTIGESLDEIAGRIGCVWVWNRYSSQLILRPIDYGIQGVAGEQGPYSVPLWNSWNARFRSGGGFNQVTNDLPSTRWVSVHPIRYVSIYGLENDPDVFVDWRSMATPDGARHLSLESSDRPPLFYCGGSGKGRVQFVGDHVPAFYGAQGEAKDVPIDTQPNTSDWSVWNLDETPGQPRNRWFVKDWSVAVSNRQKAIADRYYFAPRLTDGEVVLNRLPAYGEVSPMMNESPAASLQWDEVRFGMGDSLIQYRLFGSNTDAILFPHFIKPDRVKAMGLGSTYQANGYVNLQRIERRGGIVRTFLAEFKQDSALVVNPKTGDPVVWLYQFKEVCPESLPEGVFRKGNEWGDAGLAAEGRALNLCEMPIGGNYVSSFIYNNFDGGTLRYEPASSEVKIVRASPRGVGPCYEYITPAGMTVFFIYAPPGIQVICPGSTTPLLNPAWKSSGASGVAFPDDLPLSGIVSDTPAEQKDIVVGNLPPLAIDETTLATNPLPRRPNPINPTGMP